MALPNPAFESPEAATDALTRWIETARDTSRDATGCLVHPTADEARACTERLAQVANTAAALQLWPAAEVATGLEVVFEQLCDGARLSESDRVVLQNVLQAFDRICDRIDRHEPVMVSLELIGDALDRLLGRLESAA